MGDSTWSGMMRKLSRGANQKPERERKNSTARDYVQGSSSQLRSLDHIPLHSRTPSQRHGRLHTTDDRYMPRHKEDRVHGWIQRPNNDYEDSTRHSHRHNQDDRHLSRSRKSSLAPADGSGGYLRRHNSHREESSGFGIQRRDSHRSSSRSQQEQPHRSTSRGRRTYDEDHSSGRRTSYYGEHDPKEPRRRRQSRDHSTSSSFMMFPMSLSGR